MTYRKLIIDKLIEVLISEKVQTLHSGSAAELCHLF